MTKKNLVIGFTVVGMLEIWKEKRNDLSPPKFTLKRKLHTEKKSNQTLNNQYDRYSALVFFSSDSTFLVCTSFLKNDERTIILDIRWMPIYKIIEFCPWALLRAILSPFEGCFDEFFVYVKKHPCNYYLYEIKNMDKNTRGNKKKRKVIQKMC